MCARSHSSGRRTSTRTASSSSRRLAPATSTSTVSLVAIAPRIGRPLSLSALAGGRDDPPQAAVQVDVVTANLARPLVLVEVEGPPVVGHLQLPVAAPDRPEASCVDTRARSGRLARDHR